MELKEIVFYALAALTLGSGLAIVLSRDIVRVAFWLLAALLGVAGLYITLGADFIGFTQVLVYVGGILVLILFGIMMTNKDAVLLKRGETSGGAIAAGLFAALVVSLGLVRLVVGADWVEAPPASDAPTTAALGDALLTKYVLPFELISVLLLVVLCGAAYVARRRAEES
jgi:NADH:ubiquinone oxidoreductase subunit 6 (subunit J)